jgi:hypothetical protein
MGGSRIEAEHVLLALAVHTEWPAGRLLCELDLDHEALRRAFDAEFKDSLAAVGISLEAFALPAVSAVPGDGPRYLGQSTKVALQRALRARSGRGRARRLTSLHLLLGILQPEGGTTARALAAVGVDRNRLLGSVHVALEEAA